jgi:hypothetical protein
VLGGRAGVTRQAGLPTSERLFLSRFTVVDGVQPGCETPQAVVGSRPL